MRTIAAVLFLLAALPVLAADQSPGTREEAVNLVKKAVAYYKSVGREKAFAAFTRQGGPFSDRDLYIVVYDLEGNCLAHGANPRQVGVNLLDMRDPEGRFFVRERVELGRLHDSFWQNYKFINPMTRRLENKSMYMEKVDGLLIGCGVYSG